MSTRDDDGKATTEWQTCPNPDVRILHTRTRFPFASLDFGDYGISELSPRQRNLIKTIRAINGVQCVTLNGYEIQVEKGSLFDWTEIEPLVERALTAFGAK